MADQIDLDALEQAVEEAKARSLGSLAFSMDTVVIDALIDRLKKAEAELRLEQADRMLADAQLADLTARLREVEDRLQEKQDELDVAYGSHGPGVDRWFSALDKATARLASLERVREAAQELADAVRENHLAYHTLEYHNGPAVKYRHEHRIRVALKTTWAALDVASEEKA